MGEEIILTAHQPVYLPWLGLFHKIALSDIFCYFNEVQYLKKDWNNRNKIKTASGNIWLTVPVLTGGHRDKKISDIEINNSINWQKKHWRSIYFAHQKAPFFSKYSDFFDDVYNKKKWERLADLNKHMLKWFLDVLGIRVQFLEASQFQFKGKKNDLVLDMCRQLKADTYIFGALGKDYVDVESFEKSGIKVVIQEYNHPVYTQLHPGFISHLSIVDLLFNHGQRSLEIIMENNIAKEDLLVSRMQETG